MESRFFRGRAAFSAVAATAGVVPTDLAVDGPLLVAVVVSVDALSFLLLCEALVNGDITVLILEEDASFVPVVVVSEVVGAATAGSRGGRERTRGMKMLNPREDKSSNGSFSSVCINHCSLLGRDRIFLGNCCGSCCGTTVVVVVVGGGFVVLVGVLLEGKEDFRPLRRLKAAVQ